MKTTNVPRVGSKLASKGLTDVGWVQIGLSANLVGTGLIYYMIHPKLLGLGTETTRLRLRKDLRGCVM